MKPDKFIVFLIKAKKSTYAAGNNKTIPVRPGAVDFVYKEKDFTYVDSYFGSTCFSGQEVVYENDNSIWSMNYYGKTLSKHLPPGFSETLKEALMLVRESSPFRGPEQYKRGDYEYTCRYEGTVDHFSGEEEISHKGEKVYHLYFHGGSLE